MPKKDYELLEHTADIRIRVKAADLKDLFANAACAMFDILAQRTENKEQKTEKLKINLKSGDLEELFVNWLNDLLSLSSAKELIFSDFKINKLSENKLEAQAQGLPITGYKVNTEIKAATYHQLKLEKIKSGWQVEVIFDV